MWLQILNSENKVDPDEEDDEVLRQAQEYGRMWP